MKRKLSLFLVVLALLALLSPATTARAENDVCFISINDTLMDLSSQAYFQGSSVYVPYTVFVNFKIYNFYFTADETASLYTSTKQLYFDLKQGYCYDGEGNTYTSAALWVNGQVYVPVSFVCLQYGLSWSHVAGEGYGDICRIKDSSVILSDTQFLAAATTLMQNYYTAYMQGSPDKDAPNDADEPKCSVYLSFQGVPSAALLDTLKRHNVTTTFFLTAYGIRQYPEIVRRAVGEGHSIGILCAEAPYVEYLNAEELLFEAAHTTTLLIASGGDDYDEACRADAQRHGLVFWDYGIDGVQGGLGISYPSTVTAPLAYAEERADVRLLCCDATDSCIALVLNFIASGSYQLRPLCEVGTIW